MASGTLSILGIIAALLVGAVAIGLIVVLAIKFIGLLFRLIGHVFATIGRWIGDVFRLIGAVVVAVVFVPLILLNIVIGRWSASAHYGRALTDEEYQEAERNGLALNPKSTADKADDALFDEAIGEIYHRGMAIRAQEA